MQTFIYGLLLAGVSGVTVVAFKHPGGFARLFPYMLGIATIAFSGITIWHIAVEMTWRSLYAYIVQEALSDAKATKGRLSVLYTWIVFWYLGVVAFLYVNLKLPPFLHTTDANDTNGGKEKTR
jgi:hypothetical protein